VCITPVANPAGALAIKSLATRANYRGRGNTKASVTVTSDSAWHVVGNTAISANSAANIQLAYVWDCYGRYVIPPAGTFGVCSLVNTGTVPCTPFVIWQEVMLVQG